ncbi:MAG: phage tail tape measure protein, partial [Cyanobacteria bacterium P01_D01_bin.73]
MSDITLNIETTGGDEANDSLENLAKSAAKTGRAFKELSKDLRVSEGELKRIAKTLGLNEAQLRKVITSMGEWRSLGAESDRQFAALKKSIDGINPAQFKRLTAIIQKTSAVSKQAAAETGNLAKATKEVGKAAQGRTPPKPAKVPANRSQADRSQPSQNQPSQSPASSFDGDGKKAVDEFTEALNKSRDEASSLAKELEAAGKSAGGAAGAIANLGGEGSGTASAMVALQNQFGQLGTAADRLLLALEGAANGPRSRRKGKGQQANSTPAKAVASSVDTSLTGVDLGINFEQAQKLQQELKLNPEEFAKTGQILSQLRGTGATTQGVFRALEKEVGLTSDQFQLLEKSINPSIAGMEELAGVAAGLSEAIATPLKEGIKTFADFEGKIRQTGVFAQAYDTEAGKRSLQSLTAEVERLGASTPKSAAEIADFTNTMSQSGFSLDHIEKGLEGITNASIATGESMEDVGDVVGDVVKKFGLTASDSGQIADVLVAAVNNSPQDVKDLGEALGNVGEKAKASGQTLESTVNVLTRMAEAGIKGGDAGTALAAAMDQVDLSSAATSAKMGELFEGNSNAIAAFENLKLAATNADGSLKQMPDVLDAIKASTRNLSEGETAALVNSLFGASGGEAIIATLGLTDEKIREINKSQEEMGGIAARASEQMKQGLSGAFSELDSALGSAFLDAGQALAPIIEPLVRGLTLIVQGFSALPAPIQAAIVGVAGFTAVVAAGISILAGLQAANAALALANLTTAATEQTKLVAMQGAIAGQIASTAVTIKSTAANIAATVATTAFAIAQKLLSSKVLLAVGAVAAMAVGSLAVAPAMLTAAASSGVLSVGLGGLAAAGATAMVALAPLIAPLLALGAAAVGTKL